MGIQKDAGEILLYIYECYTKDETVNAQKLLEITKWDGKRIDRAIKFLKELGAISIILTFGNINGVQNFILKGITPTGIMMVENKPEFKRNFNFTVDLGLIKYSWGTSEK